MVMVMVCNRRDFLVCGCASSRPRKYIETSSAYGEDETRGREGKGFPANNGIELKVGKPPTNLSDILVIST